MSRLSDGATRRGQLRTLEDKRLAFAEKVRGEGFDPEFSIYIQRAGGFWGLAVNGDERCVLYGPQPDEDADFRVERYPRGALTVGLLPAVIESSGLGGAFGLGQKGGEGKTLVVITPQGVRIEMTLLSSIGAYLETNRKSNELISLRRARSDANFVWRLRTGTRAEVDAVMTRWHAWMSN